MNVLLLGGTAEARDLSLALAKEGITLVSSLAGVTKAPATYGGSVRYGGFGGASGLAGFLAANKTDILIDATHPFAARISLNAVEAAEATGTRVLQLVRPSWPERENWQIVPSLKAAAESLIPNTRVFLATGGQSACAFAGRTDVFALLRVIDRPDGPFPLANGDWIIDRAPYCVEDELAMFRARRIDTLVARNSGGARGQEKFDAAQTLGLHTIVVARPPLPNAMRVETVKEALAWVAAKT